MSYFDYCLKFTTKEEADAVLFTEVPEVKNEEGEVITEAYMNPNYENIDVIGDIYRPTGETQEIDGGTFPVYEKLEGYHANVRTTKPHEELDKYSVYPKNPARVWA